MKIRKMSRMKSVMFILANTAILFTIFGINASSIVQGNFQQIQTVQYHPNLILTKPRSSTSGATAISAYSSRGFSLVKTYQRVGNIQVVRIPPNLSVESAIESLKSTQLFEYVEPNFRVKINQGRGIPNDLKPQLWGLDNQGQNNGSADADIDAPEAWSVHHNAESMIVGVIDTGIDYRHEDLAHNMWVNPGEIPGDKIDNDQNGYVDDVYGIDAIRDNGDPWDDHGHGTHCGGTIGASGNNGIGVVGVNWRVKLMALKFLNSGGWGDTHDAIECIEYAIQNKVDVLSNSWGGGGYSQSLYDSILRADNAGIIFVAAAGNHNNNNDASLPIQGS